MIPSPIANVLLVRRRLSDSQKRELAIRMSDAFRGATVTLTVRMKRDLRYRLGMLLIRLGVRVLGARSSVVPDPGACSSKCRCTFAPVSVGE